MDSVFYPECRLNPFGVKSRRFSSSLYMQMFNCRLVFFLQKLVLETFLTLWFTPIETANPENAEIDATNKSAELQLLKERVFCVCEVVASFRNRGFHMLEEFITAVGCLMTPLCQNCLDSCKDGIPVPFFIFMFKPRLANISFCLIESSRDWRNRHSSNCWYSERLLVE